MTAHTTSIGDTSKQTPLELAVFAFAGFTLVVSPLVSLMEDQLLALRRYNVEACLLNASSSKADVNTVQAGESKSPCEGNFRVNLKKCGTRERTHASSCLRHCRCSSNVLRSVGESVCESCKASVQFEGTYCFPVNTFIGSVTSSISSSDDRQELVDETVVLHS